MAGFWMISNRSAASSPATASQAAPSKVLNAGMQLRLRSLECTLSGSLAGSDQLVVRDGPTQTGTVIATFDLSIPANGFAVIQLPVDLRATVGNALTVEFVSGVGSARENVNAQGDIVPIGWPLGQP